MKKIFSLILAVLAVLSLAACGNEKVMNETASADNSQTKQSNTPTENSTENKNRKVLIAYFSASGNTKQVAEYIAKETNGDLFEITPAEPYTSDDLNWTVDGSRVNIEHEDESKRDIPLIKDSPDNFAEYDTVYIGYPIWWAIAAWPVNNFVKNNDFTDKTVIPFCTSSDSGIGRSGELLKEMAGTGNWQEGIRFRSGVSEEDVLEWVRSINK
ncbi:MAG: flavodoxin [Acutalibacteraceae bacterium]